MDKQKNFLEDIAAQKPESYKEEVFIAARRGPGRIIAAVIALLLIAVLVFIWQQIGRVTVPDMSSWQLEEVETWVSGKHENTVLNGIYSKEVSTNTVISQDIKAGNKINNNSTFTVTYSLGADPDEAVEVPDLKNMPITDIQSWIDDNQMSGVTLQYESSDIIPKDSVISIEYIEGSQEQFLRKNRMIIYVSSGAEDMNATIQMPDMYGKTRAELMQWSQENQIKIDIKEEYNEYVDYGLVFEQSIDTDTKITHNDTVSVTISRGKAITVPEFTGMSRSEASDLAALYGINVFYKLVISAKDADTVLSQDVETGMEIDGQQLVTLEIAKEDGKSIVPDFIGLTQNEAGSLANLYGIKLFVENSDEIGSNGIVTTQSVIAGKKIDEGQVVTVTLKVNDTNQVVVPDFTGMTKNEASIAAQDLGIQLLFNEEANTNAKNQTVTSQSVKAGGQVDEGRTILLNIAVNSGIIAVNVWNMKLSEVQAWAAGEGINLNIIEFYSSDYPSGKLYYQDTDEGDYIQSTKVFTVYKSLGLVMADSFVGKTKSEILTWRDEVNSKGANIKLEFLNDNDTPKGKGVITAQSISGDLVKLDQIIQVWVSASDKGVIMRDFTGILPDNFKLWCEANSIPYVITDYYSDTVAAGTLFGQNYTNTYLPKNEYLRIHNSLGKIYLSDFTNQTIDSMVAWQKDVNSKGGNVKINFLGYYSGIQRNTITYQALMNTEIGLDETITVVYSLGPS